MFLARLPLTSSTPSGHPLLPLASWSFFSISILSNGVCFLGMKKSLSSVIHHSIINPSINKSLFPEKPLHLFIPSSNFHDYDHHSPSISNIHGHQFNSTLKSALNSCIYIFNPLQYIPETTTIPAHWSQFSIQIFPTWTSSIYRRHISSCLFFKKEQCLDMIIKDLSCSA